MSPFGIALVSGTLCISNADAIIAVPYSEGTTRTVVTLPGGPLNNHWTKNITMRGVLQSSPQSFASGMFIGEHGSWNRSQLAGYKVVFVPFEDGEPSGAPLDVLGGFVDTDEQARGRPVGVAVDRRGGLLVADDGVAGRASSLSPSAGARAQRRSRRRASASTR